MRLSEERISHIAHRVSDALWRGDLVDFKNDAEALKAIKGAIVDYLSVEDTADVAARRKIASLSRHVPEGSPEWDTLYRKYINEELAKKRF